MRFFTAATTALLFSAQALAGITQYTLSIEADDERVNGKGITFKHEGAGINYAFVSDSSAKFNYDDESKLFYYPISPQLNYNLGTAGDIVQFSVTPPSSVEIGDDGALKFEGSDELSLQSVLMIHTIILTKTLLLLLKVKPCYSNQTCG